MWMVSRTGSVPGIYLLYNHNNWKFNREGEWVWSTEVPIEWISEVSNNEGSKSYIMKHSSKSSNGRLQVEILVFPV